MALTKCSECGSEVSDNAAACPHCGNQIKSEPTKFGCGALIGAFILFALISSVVSKNDSHPSPPKAPPKATAKAASQAKQVAAVNEANFETCKLKLQSAQKLDVLYQMDWKPGREPHVVVGPTFINMPIDAKEGFAETLSCFFTAGDMTKLANFDLLHWQTGKRVGRYSYGKLSID